MNDWREEVRFWSNKFEAAHIRWKDADERGDYEALQNAIDQMQLYLRRRNALIPKHVQEQFDLERAEQKRAALAGEI